MSLAEQLSTFRKNFEAKVPEDRLDAMHRALEELRSSGILNRVLKKGDRAPDFTLPDSNGTLVSSAALRSQGPLVVSFFRGKW